MPRTSFHWLLVGAAVGFAAVAIIGVFALPIPGWVAALLTTLSASVFGGMGPRETPRYDVAGA